MAEGLDAFIGDHTRRKQMTKPVKKKIKTKLTEAIKIKLPPRKPQTNTMISNKFYRNRPFNPTKKYKAGIFVANMRNDGLIQIGFSFCNHYAGDRYDYVKGKRMKGFGLKAALNRSTKWNDYAGFIIGPPAGKDSIWKEIEAVFIPHFAAGYLYEFLLRCDRYYRFLGDKLKYPEWVSRFKSECTYIKKEKKDDRSFPNYHK